MDDPQKTCIIFRMLKFLIDTPIVYLEKVPADSD